jgi:large subunit ribosomal protein L21
MYAIVSIAGQQFKVSENKPVYVHRLDAKEGDSVKFDQVLMVGGNGSIKVGAPMVSGASVSATVVSHVKGDKVLIFKKKRRKGYQKLNGHRQSFTKITVDKISL